jgi:hypothetical protein
MYDRNEWHCKDEMPKGEIGKQGKWVENRKHKIE